MNPKTQIAEVIEHWENVADVDRMRRNTNGDKVKELVFEDDTDRYEFEEHLR